ncbi:39605_t:CDS:2, partial [Gigaspora margarita]
VAENNISNSKWDEEYFPSVRIEKHWYDTLSEPITIEEWNQILQESKTNLDIWQHQDVRLDERVWRSNARVNTIEQCKNLDLIFDMLERSWHLQENGPLLSAY